ncbi:MAG TPA: hypothetical protein VGJ20_25320 [Xanthobacteraceae bacterium]|jgi:hypothetical protein
MPTIDTGQGILTFINVFTVQPEKQGELVSLRTTAARHTMRHLPGFVSANICEVVDAIEAAPEAVKLNARRGACALATGTA